MPKIVDHNERKEELAEAVWRVILRLGTDGVTIRSVAHEAGWSRGVVGHYFRDKNDLVMFAFQMVSDRLNDRVRNLIRGRRGRDALRVLIEQCLPLDGPRSTEEIVWLGFVDRASGDPALRRIYRTRYGEWRRMIGAILTEMIEYGELHAEVDLDAETDALVALIDGVSLQALLNPSRYTPRYSRRLIDKYLARLSES